MLKAVTRQAAQVDAKIQKLNAAPDLKHPISTSYFFDHYATPEDVAVMVTERDFMDAHRELIPSVSAGELAHYERVRATFEGGRENQPAGTSGVAEGKRPMSASSRLSPKGKGKAVFTGKGKGKAPMPVNGADEDDEDDGYAGDDMNGGASRAQAKGKGVATFQHGGASDDEGLYD